MKEFTYHFCAMHQPEAGTFNYSDGTFTCDRQLRTKDDYIEAKRKIADGAGTPAEKLIVLSLTLIGQLDNSP